MTLCQFDDGAECNVARVTVGGPRVAVLATRGATCVGYPSSPAAPSSRGPAYPFKCPTQLRSRTPGNRLAEKDADCQPMIPRAAVQRKEEVSTRS
ncbi:hypothetical protein K0M31_019449 [Melipona bicolor]|uniref:Uncharacterized protein n=1 Tax=Melipona bicolor TaxID=60889 RepID=A0AA40KR43_9HYME|nr:hypothetical protein K0M31_019449 [Melipona bicolor]